MKEDVIQESVIKLYEAYGGDVYDLSQGYRAPPPGVSERVKGYHAQTRQTPGLPDLWIFFVKWGAKLWHETKALTARELRPVLPLDPPWRKTVTRRGGRKVLAKLSEKELRLLLSDPNFYTKALGALELKQRLGLYEAKLSAEQGIFRDRCRRTSQNHVTGGIEEAHLFVETYGQTFGRRHS